jgi:hypothetical protein
LEAAAPRLLTIPLLDELDAPANRDTENTRVKTRGTYFLIRGHLVANRLMLAAGNSFVNATSGSSR